MQASVVQCTDGRGGPALPTLRPTGIDAAKSALRSASRTRRRAGAGKRGDAGNAIAAQALATVPFPPRLTVAGYWPLGDEADPRPLMRALAARGHPLCLPVVVGPGRPLIFRAWKNGDALEPGVFGTSVPRRDSPECAPAALLVPLLAVDRGGFRLGYGGGYYDRTLAGLPGALAVGIAFHDQLCDRVPRDERDRPVDWLVCELGARRCGGDDAA